MRINNIGGERREQKFNENRFGNHCAAGGLGIFYWQVREARADVVETWGMADAKEININSKVSGRVVSLLVD